MENTGQKTNQKQTLLKLSTTQKKQTTQNAAKQKNSLVQSPLTTVCQETRWTCSTKLPSPHVAHKSTYIVKQELAKLPRDN